MKASLPCPVLFLANLFLFAARFGKFFRIRNTRNPFIPFANHWRVAIQKRVFFDGRDQPSAVSPPRRSKTWENE
jgi:hypothetical protein